MDARMRCTFFEAWGLISTMHLVTKVCDFLNHIRLAGCMKLCRCDDFITITEVDEECPQECRDTITPPPELNFEYVSSWCNVVRDACVKLDWMSSNRIKLTMMKCTTDDRFLNQIALASLWIFLTHYGHLVTEVVVDGWQSEERSLPKLLYQHCRNVECVQLINVPDDATFGPLTKVLLGFCSRNRILRFKCMRPEVDLNSMTPMPHPFPDINDRDEAAGKLLQYIIAHTGKCKKKPLFFSLRAANIKNETGRGSKGI